MAGILEGLKVVAVEHVEAGPATTAILADWGADVIKVEPPSGEMLRGLRRTMGVDVRQFNVIIELLSRNKKGLAVDLKKESGRDILYQLVKKADVFISNYVVDVLGRLKLDYATLSQLNPGLIYAVITGYGMVGPDKDEPGYDVTAGWARSGIQYLLGEPGSPPPAGRQGMVDRVTAGFAAAGICAALVHREKTGKGQELELSLYNMAVWMLGADIQNALVGLPTPKHDRTKAENPIWSRFRTKDDRWLQLGMLQFDRHWPDFCRAIERPELINDPRFNNWQAAAANCEELIRIIDAALASATREEWEKRFKANNCIYGRIETPQEVIKDPQALANDFFAEIDHPVLGKVRLVNTPVKFHQNPASVRSRAPEIGQHNEEILLSLGYSWEDIARLKEQGVVL